MIKNSREFKDKVKKIMDGKKVGSLKFSYGDLFGSLHNVTIIDVKKSPSGDYQIILLDVYDFALNHKYHKNKEQNNNGYYKYEGHDEEGYYSHNDKDNSGYYKYEGQDDKEYYNLENSYQKVDYKNGKHSDNYKDYSKDAFWGFVNSSAWFLQSTGSLSNYYLVIPIKLSKEEADKIKNSISHTKNN